MDTDLAKIPLVSVLMPVYNSENYIKEAISSILNQTYQNIELLIINDGSTDRSEEIICSFSDNRIRYHSNEKNLGISDSLNLGIELARGTYIVRMDSDDISVLDRIEKQVLYMLKNPDIVCSGSGYEYIHKSYKWIPNEKHEEIMLSMIDGCPMAHPTIIFKASILHEYNIKYYKSYEPAEDYKMWTTLVKYGKFGNIKEILLRYRVHAGQVSNIKNEEQHKIGKVIRKEFFNYLLIDNHITKQLLVEKLEPINYSKYLKAELLLIEAFKSKGIIITKHLLKPRRDKFLLAHFMNTPFLSFEMLNILKILIKSNVNMISFSKSLFRKIF